MNRLRTLVFYLAALLAPTLALADAADDAALVNGKVQIAAENGDKGYRLTKNADYSAIRDNMMKRQALEEFAKFLSPMKLRINQPRTAGRGDSSPASVSINDMAFSPSRFRYLSTDAGGHAGGSVNRVWAGPGEPARSRASQAVQSSSCASTSVAPSRSATSGSVSGSAA